MQSQSVNNRGYAHPELLAETDWLAHWIHHPKLRVIDARQPSEYLLAHLPGAVNISGFGGIPRAENGDMAEPKAFSRLASTIGISNDMTVIVYDAPGQMMGTVAWAFLYYGHPDVRILDGGFAKWVSEGRPTSTEVPDYPPAVFVPKTVDTLYCSLSNARKVISSPRAIFWDTRSLPEYQGAAPTGHTTSAIRQGRIPGAVHLEWGELFESETRILKPANELHSILASRGITPESEINTY